MTRAPLHLANVAMVAIMSIAAAAAAAPATEAVAAGRAAAHVQSGPPADDAAAKVRLAESSRHGEYVDIAVPARATPIRAFVVYPEIATKAPVVIVLHETSGLTDWIRGVTDQLAADGFIAIAPDLPAGTSANDPALQAVHAYGAKLPAATGKTTPLQLQGPSSVANWPGTLTSLRQQVQ